MPRILTTDEIFGTNAPPAAPARSEPGSPFEIPPRKPSPSGEPRTLSTDEIFGTAETAPEPPDTKTTSRTFTTDEIMGAEEPSLAMSTLKSVPKGAVETAATGLSPAVLGRRRVQNQIRALSSRVREAPDLDDTSYQALQSDIINSGLPQVAKSELSRTATGLREGRIDPSQIPDFVQPFTDNPPQRAQTAMREFSAESLDIPPEHQDRLPVQIGQAAGSTLAYVGARAIPGVGQALLPITAASIGAGEAIDRAAVAGASDEEMARAGLMGTVPGLTDMLPIERLFKPIARLPGLKGALYGVARKAVEQGLIEGTQEGVQQFLQNAIARFTHTPEQDIAEGIAENGEIGFIVGMLFGGAGGSLQTATQPAPEAAAPTPPAEAPVEPAPAPQAPTPPPERSLEEVVNDPRPVDEIRAEDEARDAAAEKRAADQQASIQAVQQYEEQARSAMGLPEAGTETMIRTADGETLTGTVEGVFTVGGEPGFRFRAESGDVMEFYGDEAQIVEDGSGSPSVAPAAPVAPEAEIAPQGPEIGPEQAVSPEVMERIAELNQEAAFTDDPQRRAAIFAEIDRLREQNATPTPGPANPVEQAAQPPAAPANPPAEQPSGAPFADRVLDVRDWVHNRKAGKVTPRAIAKAFDVSIEDAQRMHDTLRARGVLTEKGYKPNRRLPRTVTTIIKEMGGMKPSGEAKARDLGKVRPGLVNRKGRTLNDIRTHLEELGMLPEGSTDDAVFDLIDNELSGNPAYHPDDDYLVERVQAQQQADEETDAAAAGLDHVRAAAERLQANIPESALPEIADGVYTEEDAIDAVDRYLERDMIAAADAISEEIVEPFDIPWSDEDVAAQIEQDGSREEASQGGRESEGDAGDAGARPAAGEQPGTERQVPSREGDEGKPLLISTGMRLRSKSGRELSPAPKIDATTDRKTKSTIQRIDAWLQKEAIAESLAEGNEFAADQARYIDLKNISPSDRDVLNLLVFDRIEGPTQANVIEDESPRDKASREASEASAKFRAITDDYNAGRISDEEFLAAQREHKAAQDRFDEADGVTARAKRRNAAIDREAKAKAAEKPTYEQTDQGEQAVLPGAEKISDREYAERQMQGRKKAKAPQKDADDNLFDVAGRKQQDLESRPPSDEQAAQRSPEDMVRDAEAVRAELVRLGIADKVALTIHDQIMAVVEGRMLPAQGRYIRGLIQVALNTGDPVKTLRHEAIHAMKDLGLFTDGEWAVLEGRSRKEWMAKYDIASRYADFSEDIQVEEGIAHAFADYARGEANPGGRVARLFARMRRLIETLGNALRGRGFNTVEGVLGRVEKGEVGRRQPKGEGAPIQDRYALMTRKEAVDMARQQEAQSGYRWLVRKGERGQWIAYTKFRPIELTGGNPDMLQQAKRREIMGQDETERLALPPRPQQTPAFGAVFEFSDRKARDIFRDRSMPLMARLKMGVAAATDHARVKVQDKFLSLKRIQQTIEKLRGRPLDETVDAYEQQLIFHGRAGKKLDDFQEQHVEPLIQAINDEGLTLADVELYLYARHAKERNAQIAAINPDMPDGGSGMTDAEAQDILDDFQKRGMTTKLDRIASRVDAINKARLDILEEGGLIDAKTRKRWEQAYENYVPLRGFEAADDVASATARIGKGYDIRGDESKRAKGRESKADAILAHVVAQYEEAVVRAEKNKVGRSFLKLVQQNPDPDLWEIDERTVRRVVNKSTGLVEYMPDPNRRRQDDILAVKVGGKVHYITIKHQGLARAMKNLGIEEMNSLTRFLQMVNRALAFLNTSLNPEFVFSNFARDIQTAGINLQEFQIKGLTRAIMRDALTFRGHRGVYGGVRGKRNTDWQRYYHEFAEEGGKIAFFGLEDIEARKKRLERQLKDINPNTIRRGVKAVKNVGKFIQDVNAGIENNVRLATYVNLRRNGVSKQKAARVARELTVNFNQKGEWGPALGSLYLFYNASIQGSIRIIQALKHRRVRRLVTGIVVANIGLDLMNAWMSGDDDDDEQENYYDKISDWTKDHNLIVMNPFADSMDNAIALKFPLPYGYNVFSVLGRNIGETMRGKKSPIQAGADIAVVALDSFNPLGGAGSLIQFMTPTILRPAVESATNENFMGAPIMPEPNPYDKSPPPDSQLYWNNASGPSKWATEKINELTGGSVARPGAIDVSPETLDHFFDFSVGGAGAFARRSAEWGLMKATGEKTEWRQVPFARRLVEGPNEWRDRQVYREIERRVETFEEEQKTLRRTPRTSDDYEHNRKLADRHLEKYAVDRQMVGAVKAADKQLKDLRKKRKRAEAAENDEAAKAITERMDAIHRRIINRYLAIEKRVEEE